MQPAGTFDSQLWHIATLNADYRPDRIDHHQHTTRTRKILDEFAKKEPNVNKHNRKIVRAVIRSLEPFHDADEASDNVPTCGCVVGVLSLAPALFGGMFALACIAEIFEPSDEPPLFFN